MGLLDIFKKKKTKSSYQENELELCLRHASTNVISKKDFYQKLIWNQLFILTTNNSISDIENSDLKSDTTVEFVVFEKGRIPIFSSTNKLFEKNILKQGTPFINLKGLDLFEGTKGATFILNPFSDCAKELSPEEIESVMNGTIFQQIDKNENENEKNQEFNIIFDRACKRQNGLIFLDGYKRKPLPVSDKLKLEESVDDYKKCLDIFPKHWQSMVLMAKGLQRLERHFESLEQLEFAFRIELEDYTIPMEASLEAMHAQNIEKAIFYSAESLKRKPKDFTLMGNHAMNLLIAEKDNEAKRIIEDAVRIEPNDTINKNIESLIRNVLNGNCKRPSFEDSIR